MPPPLSFSGGVPSASRSIVLLSAASGPWCPACSQRHLAPTRDSGTKTLHPSTCPAFRCPADASLVLHGSAPLCCTVLLCTPCSFLCFSVLYSLLYSLTCDHPIVLIPPLLHFHLFVLQLCFQYQISIVTRSLSLDGYKADPNTITATPTGPPEGLITNLHVTSLTLSSCLLSWTYPQDDVTRY